ncbi:uncharacterized protein RAG0_09918 [Rhynchosporium agropyri]|uniref:Uncharacterized protein n=1 Tax=Rhynchosporium agropyri TaxID=914238 RepID=A0A1E1KXQ4_9HELO|nr:uncharacterized protein RAG0_09918 [Rhynchosporium agropyri]
MVFARISNASQANGKSNDQTTPSSWTLLFKHSKITILLLIEPLTPLPTILTELLTSLHERYPSGLPTSDSLSPIEIPESGIDVIFGVRKDEFDPTKGWQEVKLEGAGMNDSPKSLGWKDGIAVAFAFEGEEGWRERKEFDVQAPNVDELYPEEE